MRRLTIDDFSGGSNTRDSVNALELSETPEAINWTLDERGALRFRKGCQNLVALPSTGAAYIFYSAALDKWLCNQNSAVYVRPGDLSGSWTDLTLTSLGSGAVAFIDFPGNPPKVVMVNTTGGVYTYDGTTDTRVSSTVRGSCVALWQNKAWVGGYPTSDANGNPTSIFNCAAGDPATWGAAVNQFRELNAAPVTALGVVGGGLLAFKKRSSYRVNNADTGAYTTIDGSAGSVAPTAVTSVGGVLYSWGADGLYAWDGVGPGRSVADRLRPVFTRAIPDLGGAPMIAAKPLADRVVFAYPTITSTRNNRLLEYEPDTGASAIHALAGYEEAGTEKALASLAVKEHSLYAAVTDGLDLFEMFSDTAGSDDGTVYAATYRTPWIQPENGKLCRLSRVELQALIGSAYATTTLKLRVFKDFDLSSYDEYDVSNDVRGGDSSDQQEVAVIQSLGHSRAFAFEFVAGTAAGEVTVRSLTLETTVLER